MLWLAFPRYPCPDCRASVMLGSQHAFRARTLQRGLVVELCCRPCFCPPLPTSLRADGVPLVPLASACSLCLQGDILFLNMGKKPISVGEIIIFKIDVSKGATAWQASLNLTLQAVP